MCGFKHEHLRVVFRKFLSPLTFLGELKRLSAMFEILFVVQEENEASVYWSTRPLVLSIVSETILW